MFIFCLIDAFHTVYQPLHNAGASRTNHEVKGLLREALRLTTAKADCFHREW